MSFLLTVSAALLAACGGGGGESGHDHDHDHGEGESHEEGVIELTERQMTTVGIELGHLESREIGSGLRANGTLSVGPESRAEVTPAIAGVVKTINVREGDHVRAGAVVATIENMEVLAACREYSDALHSFELAMSEKERQERLAERGAGVRKNLDRCLAEFKIAESRLRAAEGALRLAGITPAQALAGNASGVAVVKAPISGVVNKIYAVKGGYADVSSPLMSITDNAALFALLRVYEKDLSAVRPGQKVELTLTNGGGNAGGVVESINKTIDPETRGIDVRVRLTSGASDALIPGMAVSGTIYSEGVAVSTLPEEAVVVSGGRSFIYVLDKEDEEEGQRVFIFRPVEVRAGARQHGYVEVSPLEPLPEDASIVVSKAFYIASMAADHGEHNH